MIRKKNEKNYNFREATSKDVNLILDFIKGIAEYQKLSNEVVATPELLNKWLFEDRKAEVFFVLNEQQEEVGFTLYFTTFSTFLACPGIHLEDIYVKPVYRNQGYGKAMLMRLAQITVEKGYGRLEWNCLSWNKPSIEFYKSLGAKLMDDWLTFRLTNTELKKYLQ